MTEAQEVAQSILIKHGHMPHTSQQAQLLVDRYAGKRVDIGYQYFDNLVAALLCGPCPKGVADRDGWTE
jgi:hypothetical protein